jgi:hypothetical protein
MKFQVIRLLTFVVSVAMVALVGAVGTATTATAQPASGGNTNVVPVEGINPDTGEKVFSGTFTATSAKEDPSARTGAALVGELKGQLTAQPGNPQGQGRGPQDVTQKNVAMPINAITSSGAPAGESQAACGILDLTLGPLDLNLLGLRVQLSQVDLVITAVPGPGNLLGNLLCAVAGLLDGAGGVTDLAALLQNLLQILNILGGL